MKSQYISDEGRAENRAWAEKKGVNLLPKSVRYMNTRTGEVGATNNKQFLEGKDIKVITDED